MNLIAACERLREMEQQATCAPWYYGIHPDNCRECGDCFSDTIEVLRRLHDMARQMEASR